MRTNRTLFAISCSIFLALLSGFAQETNKDNIGLPPNGTFHGSEIDSVQLNNGNLHIEIPLISLPGRGLDARLSLVYDSKGWHEVYRTLEGSGKVMPGPFSSQQLRLVGPVGGLQAYETFTGGCTQYPEMRKEVVYKFTEPNGTGHSSPKVLVDDCGTPLSGVAYMTDGSGYQIAYPSGVVTSKGGNKLYNQTIEGVTKTILEDTNGNKMTVDSMGATDTLGRSVPTKLAYNESTGKYELPYYDSDGNLQTIVVTKSPVTVQTALGCEIGWPCTEYSETWMLITEILLPNGMRYSIVYNQGSYGTPSSITLPTGARIDYAWSTNATILDAGPRVTSRTVTVEGQVSEWQYRYPGLGGMTDQTIVTDPLENEVVYTFTHTPSVSDPSREVTAEHYSGFAGGVLLKKVDTAYQPHLPYLPTIVTTTWPQQGNLQSRIETDWDSLSSTQSTISWSNPVEKREYGFGVGTPGPLARRTHYQYAHLSGNTNFNSNYVAANVATLVTRKQVYDGAGALLSDLTNYYDGTTLVPAPGVPAELHNYAQRTYRGNLTRTSVWLNTTNTWLHTDNTYDELGHLRTTTDPGLHKTNFYYDDSWSGARCDVGDNTQAYLTKTCAPNTTGQSGTVQHCSEVTYYACTGLRHSTRDQNDINADRDGTIQTYDAMNRPLCVSSTDGGETCSGYGDAVGSLNVTTTKKLDLTHNIVNASYQDGLGRVKQTLLRDPKDGDTFTETRYDLLGRVDTVTNPHRTSTLLTDGTTEYRYDALGRKILEIPPDGTELSNRVETAYSGSAVGLITTITDQAGKQRRSYTDALGRLVRVDEPALDGDIAASRATGSVTFTGNVDRQVQVPGQTAAAGTGTVTIAGILKYETDCSSGASPQVESMGMQPQAQPAAGCIKIYDRGTISIVVNGRTKTVNFGPGYTSTTYGLANALATLFNQDATATVNASVSGTSSPSVITFTARTTGANTNYSMSTAVTSDLNSFTVTRSNPTLQGGRDAVPARTEWDEGTVTITLNGLPKSTNYGQTTTATSIARALKDAFNTDSSSCATALSIGGKVEFTAKQPGTAANSCVLSATSVTTKTTYFSGTSFPVSGVVGLRDGQNDSPAIDRPLITEYKYDALDRLVCVVQKGGDTSPFTTCEGAPAPWRPRRFIYDSLSRLQTAYNPESGTISWTYDNDSNVLTKTDARATINYSPADSPIDALHRVTKKTYTNIDPNVAVTLPVTYSYDQVTEGIGQRTGMSDATGSTAWTFDTEGRVTSETRTVNIAGVTSAPVVKSLSYEYNLNGSMAAVTYPSGHRVQYSYTGQDAITAGHAYSAIDPQSGINYVTNAAYTPHGEVAGHNYGQSILVTNVWNNRFQPMSFTAQRAGGGYIQSLGFSFNQGTSSAPVNSGLLVKVNNYLRPEKSTNYTYDALNRITAAWHDGTDWGNTYTVDPWGNLHQKNPCNGTSCPERADSDSLPDGIIATVKNRLDIETDHYSYDDSGNLLDDKAGHVFVYDAENRPASVVSTATTRYYYDGEGERVAKCTEPAGGGACGAAKLYLFGTNSAPVVETDANGAITAEYIFFNGKRVAMRKADNSVHYYFSDQIGSATTVTNADGSVVEQEIEYHPYGEQVVITDTLGQMYRFTGKEHDEETGNDYFLARYYSSRFGRFLTPDWAATPVPIPYAVMGNPQTLNLYAYVQNNPITGTDPDGHGNEAVLLGPVVVLCPECALAVGIGIGAVIVYEHRAEIGQALDNLGRAIANGEFGTAYPSYYHGENIVLSQHGKGNHRESSFEGMSDAEVAAIARDPKDPRRRKAETEEKMRKRRASRQSKEDKKAPKPKKEKPTPPDKPDPEKPDPEKPDPKKPKKPEPPPSYGPQNPHPDEPDVPEWKGSDGKAHG